MVHSKPQAQILLGLGGVCSHPSCSSTLKPHTTTLMVAISIFHGRGALKSTGLWISARCALHYSLPSLVAWLICVDKGLDGRLWFGLYRSDSTIFIPATVNSAAPEWHHYSISMLNHLCSQGPEVDLNLNLFPAHINYTFTVHADYHWARHEMGEWASWRSDFKMISI